MSCGSTTSFDRVFALRRRRNRRARLGLRFAGDFCVRIPLTCLCLLRLRLSVGEALPGAAAADRPFLAPSRQGPAAFVKEAASSLDAVLAHTAESKAVELASSPRIYQVDNFLNDLECDFLRELGAASLGESLTIDKESGQYRPDSQRTSMQMYVTPEDNRDNPIVSGISRRLHSLARIPLGHGEQIQIGRYRVGDKYDCHFDSDIHSGIIRPVTIILYLADVEQGGETLFPRGAVCHPLGKCCGGNETKPLLVRPKKGRALVFHTHDHKGRLDKQALHCACPVEKGEKWISQTWFRSTLYADSPHFSVAASLLSTANAATEDEGDTETEL